MQAHTRNGSPHGGRFLYLEEELREAFPSGAVVDGEIDALGVAPDGQPAQDFDLLGRHVVLHSPTGLEWGYPGSGPGDLALSLLADAVDLDDEAALKLEPRLAHEPVKRQSVSQLGHHGWALSRDEVLQWPQSWRAGTSLPPDACDVCGAPNATVRHQDMVWVRRLLEFVRDPDEDEY